MEEKKQGYPQQQYHEPVKRYCQTLDLKDDEELIARYRECHSRQEIWPEIPEGIRRAGILEMEIYLLGTRLFMIVETPLDFDWDSAFERLNTFPLQQEWEAFTAQFQNSSALTSTGKWQLMERIFHLYTE